MAPTWRTHFQGNLRCFGGGVASDTDGAVSAVSDALVAVSSTPVFKQWLGLQRICAASSPRWRLDRGAARPNRSGERQHAGVGLQPGLGHDRHIPSECLQSFDPDCWPLCSYATQTPAAPAELSTAAAVTGRPECAPLCEYAFQPTG